MKFLPSAFALLSLLPGFALSVRLPNADTPLFYLVSSSSSGSNLLPVRMASGNGGGIATLQGSGIPAQFYFYQGALTVHDPSSTNSYRPFIDSQQNANGCETYGAFGFVQGTSTNKCAQYTSFQIQSDSENSQVGAQLVFNYAGALYSCNSDQEVWYKLNAGDGPSGCTQIGLWTVPVA